MSSEKTVFESWMDGIGTDPNGFLSSLFDNGVATTKVSTTKKKKKPSSKKTKKGVRYTDNWEQPV